MNAIALQRTVSDMVAEYEAKNEAIPNEIQAFGEAVRRMSNATGVGGAYGADIWGRGGTPSVYERDARQALLISAWKAIYSRLNIDRIASANDKRLWERTIADPPPLTIDNAKATFGDYLLRSRFHILRGLAETFTALDPAYKSHAKVKIGVAGLPKRVIISNVGRFSSYGRDKVRDILNALAAYQGQMPVEQADFAELDKLHTIWGHHAGEVVIRGLTIRKFQNGNAHVIFDKHTLLEINRALAEFYGEVLPDAEGEEPAKKAPSTAVAKDLQFYPTPAAVIDEILRAIGIERARDYERYGFKPLRVLEPSCGDGRIMDEIRARGHKVVGYEVHPGRAAEARAKGHAVVTANFLEHPPSAEFDVVVMNPPFYGRHYLHHVRHALRFLKPDGRLVTVLPATAWYDHGELKGRWQDLPVASFAESGTNIPTGYLIMGVPN